ncbi:MAG: hypothetical protein WBZ04_08560 [Candidatus Nanopelagicales bacterium]
MLKIIGAVAGTALVAAGAFAIAPAASTATPDASHTVTASTSSSTADDIVMPPMPTNSTGTPGQVNFQLINNTSAPVTFNVNVSSDAQNETSLYSYQSYIYSANPQVAPGQTVVVPVVAGGLGRTDSSDPVVTVGLEGYAQFEMWVHVNTGFNSDFQNIEYKGDQTGGGDTGGLLQVNLGNGSVISNGNGGVNNDWTYVNGTAAGFSAT